MFGEAPGGTPSWNTNSWTTTSPGALTEISDFNGNSNSVGAAWALKAAAGNTGAGAVTLSTSERNGGILIALRACTTTPTITTTGTVTAVCFSPITQTTTLAYTATTNSPTSYSIDWNTAANTAGLADQDATVYTFLAGGGNMPNIAIPASLPAATYSGTLVITNGGCAKTQAIAVTINPPPTITTSDQYHISMFQRKFINRFAAIFSHLEQPEFL